MFCVLGYRRRRRRRRRLGSPGDGGREVFHSHAVVLAHDLEVVAEEGVHPPVPVYPDGVEVSRLMQPRSIVHLDCERSRKARRVLYRVEHLVPHARPLFWWKSILVEVTQK